MLTLGLAEAKTEYHGMHGRLNEASEEKQREELRKFMETKGAKAKVNPKAMPGR
jgi:ribosomal protein L7/L12